MNYKGKKIFDVEHSATSGEIRVEIDFDKMNDHRGMHPLTMQETIVTMVEFWSGDAARLKKNGGDYVATFLKQLCKEALALQLEGNYNASGVISKFKDREGWVTMDGAYGIKLLFVSGMELGEQDDYEISEVELQKVKN